MYPPRCGTSRVRGSALSARALALGCQGGLLMFPFGEDDVVFIDHQYSET
jgi:hypothetical protein